MRQQAKALIDAAVLVVWADGVSVVAPEMAESARTRRCQARACTVPWQGPLRAGAAPREDISSEQRYGMTRSTFCRLALFTAHRYIPPLTFTSKAWYPAGSLALTAWAT